jgi:hypothetical protein
MTLAVENDTAEDVVAEFGLVDLIPRLRSPLLVFGAGRDMVVPPEEAVALAAAAGDLATLVWYPEAGHGLYSELEDWISLSGEWLNELVGRDLPAEQAPLPEPEIGSTAVRIEPHSEQVRPVPPEDVVPMSTRVDVRVPDRQPVAVRSEPDNEVDEDEELPDLWDE